MKDQPTDRSPLDVAPTPRRKRFLELLRKEGLEITETGTKRAELRMSTGRITCRVKEFLHIDRIERPAN